ncbi:hypothetical protein EN866_35215 [Mesorhizobium sp. M2D.F.Ca.ET.223.01.1.1]|uniref:hypothetical protein n=1 Tax=Mesorhizobium sp. M2D.F.Ca.ET.223.01.1.1 TaxID=2563940 RepID=UPI001091FA8C|nr:hypothetical protein [Mesorhizobium sp. M2D.F.Ca.ET.223.01.1.1]TGR81667.1 hypothetical protein EN866_35215 [Mesorhizobium sp. M2D.F.Ca.ET.223.01.1.1]TGT78681.1 hypothetical protein EN802_03335 [bacterium M00.F.Ca.ET.159.01.1.1]TGT89347.1 hypothetical protein EN800_03335 [bacterium M00.F.Ca.ET.157.01.1.1]
MKGAIILVALGAILVPTGLRAADYCDDNIEPGESPDGKAMIMYSLMVQLALAERYCGAPATPPARIAIVVEEFHGCGPRARLEAEMEKRAKDGARAKITTTDELIRDVVAGDDTGISQIEIDRRAKAGIETEMGGCSELLKTQRDVDERYRNPPKWPPEPDK